MKLRRRDDVRVAGGVLALFVAAFLIYWPALGGAFLWDDVLNIDRNPLVRSDAGLLDIWTGQGYAYDYYPLTWTTWWLEWRAWARNTIGYHVLNVLLHAAAAALLWRVLVRLRLPGAFFAAFLFAVHPVNVESVAWITERKNTLSMLMLAVSLALYLDARRGGVGAPRRMYWASVAFFGLALLAKPSPVMTPVVLLLLAWWSAGRITRADVRASVPFFALSGAISIVTVLIHHSRGIGEAVVRTDGFAGRLAGAGWCVWFYLDKLLRPVHLAFVYPRWKIDPASWRHWVPLAALLVVTSLLFALRGRIGRGPVVVMIAFVAMLAPVLGFFDVYFFRYSFVSDHWQYHGSVIVFAAVAAVAARAFSGRGRGVRVAGTAAACAVLAWLGVNARTEATHYVDEPTLWRTAIAANPTSPMPLTNFASTCLIGTGRLDEARTAYLRAIELDPSMTEPYIALGQLAEREGNRGVAAAWYRQAVDTPFGGKDPRVELGRMATEDGDVPAAIDWYEQALPRATGAVRKFQEVLPTLHEQAGNTGRAFELYRMNTARSPRDAEQWFVLGEALTRHGRPAEAASAFATARRVTGGDANALYEMGARLAAHGHFGAAEQMLRDAVRARPDYGPAYNKLGVALEGQGKLGDAEQAFAKAVELLPAHLESRESLARVRAASPRPNR